MNANEVGLLVKRLQHRHHRGINRALAGLGISIVQWDVLRHLAKEPDASGHRLAELTFQTDQSFGTLAQRMLDAGLIDRTQGPGRAVRHRLTKEGDRLRTAAQKIVDKLVKKSFTALSDKELTTLGDLLARVLATPIE